LKQFIVGFLLDREALLTEPVCFEMLRSARANTTRLLDTHLATLADLWHSTSPCRKSL
jgi:hypothetical protein